MKAVKLVFVVVLLMLVIILMVQNAQPTTFKFLNWSYQVSQLLLVVIALAIGFLAGLVTAKLPRGGDRDDVPERDPRR